MNCPKCKNKGFRPTPDAPRPLQNLGGKQRFDTFDTRRYACLSCGHLFMTKESYYRDIEVKHEPELFDAMENESGS